MTPLWEELAGQTADTLATIKEGENAQASAHFTGANTRYTMKYKICYNDIFQNALKREGW